jgi:precorrin-3B C17-methyltransferase
LRLAAEADFVIALYNPASKARPEQIERAFALLRSLRAPETAVMLAQAVGRGDEALHVTRLADADPRRCDMRTLVLIGAQNTRVIERPGKPSWVYTPRRISS